MDNFKSMTIGQLRYAFGFGKIMLRSLYDYKGKEDLVELTPTMCSYNGILEILVKSISIDGEAIVAVLDVPPAVVKAMTIPLED
jgi:hypothetical protein